MRAIAVRTLGGTPELIDLPKPVPGPGEVLVHLGAASLNPADWKLATGTLEAQLPHVYPLILGVDGAGAVDAVGPGVTRLAVNDGVFGQFFHAPVGVGTYAEYVVAPESLAIAVRPRGMYNEPAAAVPTAGMTALQTLDDLGLAKKQTLLVPGASGGVGSFVVQLAANLGITTIAASRGPNRDYLHKLGAARFYDSSATNFIEEVKAGYPDGVDAILDLAHKAPEFEALWGLVRPGGTVATTTFAANAAVAVARGFRAINVDMKPKIELLDRLSAEYTKGRLRIPVELKVPLESAPDALEALREGKGRGKTVLAI